MRLRYPWQLDFWNPLSRFVWPRRSFHWPLLPAKPKPKAKLKAKNKRPTHRYHEGTAKEAFNYRNRFQEGQGR